MAPSDYKRRNITFPSGYHNRRRSLTTSELLEELYPFFPEPRFPTPAATTRRSRPVRSSHYPCSDPHDAICIGIFHLALALMTIGLALMSHGGLQPILKSYRMEAIKKVPNMTKIETCSTTPLSLTTGHQLEEGKEASLYFQDLSVETHERSSSSIKKVFDFPGSEIIGRILLMACGIVLISLHLTFIVQSLVHNNFLFIFLLNLHILLCIEDVRYSLPFIDLLLSFRIILIATFVDCYITKGSFKNVLSKIIRRYLSTRYEAEIVIFSLTTISFNVFLYLIACKIFLFVIIVACNWSTCTYSATYPNTEDVLLKVFYLLFFLLIFAEYYFKIFILF